MYVIGYPGSGKTTIVRAALALLDREVFIPAKAPVPHERYGDVWHLGVNREPFGGTDALSMSIQPAAVDMLADMTVRGDCRVLLAEGDRLANNSFFAAVGGCGHRLTVIHIAVPVAVARARARERAAANGLNPQGETWWRGRVTKVNNLTNTRPTINLDGTLPAAANAAYLVGLMYDPTG